MYPGTDCVPPLGRLADRRCCADDDVGVVGVVFVRDWPRERRPSSGRRRLAARCTKVNRWQQLVRPASPSMAGASGRERDYQPVRLFRLISISFGQ